MSAYELTKTILKDSANLKAYYRFESGALTTDSSGNSRTLTQVNTPTEDASGKYGGAVAYASASSQHHTAVNHVDFRPTGNFSISGWIKTSTTGATQNIFISAYFPASPYSGIQLIVNSSNKLVLYSYKNTGIVDGTDYKSIASSGTVTDGSWHHAVGTYDGSTLKVYVDGKMDGSVAWANAAGFDATNNKVRVGAGDNAGTANNFFNGSVDDLAFFNGTALSADQIKELYEGRYIGEWRPQTNLVGLWHLNGNSTDSSGNNNHGTDTTITYSLANGKIAQGGDFDGTNSKITIADSASLQVGQASSFTLMAWVQTDVNNTQKFIINKQSSTANMFTYNLSMSSGGKPVFGVSKQGVAANDATGNTTLSTGVWHHLTGVSDGSNLIIYLNGSSDGTSTISFTSATTNTSSLYFGQLYNDTLRWNGRIDELAIFSRALTAAEIRHWYAWSKGMYV